MARLTSSEISIRKPRLETAPTLAEQHAGAGAGLQPARPRVVDEPRWAGPIDEVENGQGRVQRACIDAATHRCLCRPAWRSRVDRHPAAASAGWSRRGTSHRPRETRVTAVHAELAPARSRRPEPRRRPKNHGAARRLAQRGGFHRQSPEYPCSNRATRPPRLTIVLTAPARPRTVRQPHQQVENGRLVWHGHVRAQKVFAAQRSTAAGSSSAVTSANS